MQTPPPVPPMLLKRMLKKKAAATLQMQTFFACRNDHLLLWPAWAYKVKISFDIVFAVVAMLLLSPFLLLFAITTKLTSPGCIIYQQERIGLHGKPFIIYKFRSMYSQSEINGPGLSSSTDDRITKWGKWMRKHRMDELPQLWNILKGDMSFVGPRPERKFYIDELSKIDPACIKLQSVKPGLTSLGQVCFGYASSISEMAIRTKYDQLYISNLSLQLDACILLYSLKIVLLGKGK